MMARGSPAQVYRQVDFDARVGTARPEELVALCFERLVEALGTAVFAQGRGDMARKSEALTRALAAVTALRLGVKGADGTAGALRHLYEGTSRTILDSVITFDAPTLNRLRDDMREIGAAMLAA